MARPDVPPVVDSSSKESTDLRLKVFKTLKLHPSSAESLADMYNVPPKEIRRVIQEIRADHIIVDELGGIFELSKQLVPNENAVQLNLSGCPETEIPIGFVADTHIGSKYERMDVLNALYDRFASLGISTVYHGGNWVDGECRFNKYDIYVHGINDQIDNFIEKYPRRDGITTHIISGDDHEGWWVQREGCNVGETMETKARKAGRDDLIDLGYMERDIELVQEDGLSTMRVLHGGGGSAYAHSYWSQKYAESLQGGEKPHIVLAGHFHKINYDYPREIHIIQGGCTEDQTPFMRKRKLEAHVGGWALWIRQARNGVITGFKHEAYTFYDKKFYQYNWSVPKPEAR